MNEAVIELIAQIDYHYWILMQLHEEMKKTATESPLDRMIDEATGYGMVRTEQAINLAKYSLSEVVRLKKILGHDSAKDEQFLQQIEQLTQPR